ncbi:hypothetical protein CXB49_13070 [Chromobacterium sp. ATCC 53434]|uniref:hypothetical protein n=1 Tax=Chromobacterium TaxID=535 RepID=UPI000C76076D|nr:hypothetical protein [Chromobacterium sp. ATCC 53434]AUH51680.1 hypothetical protein CXB49_13070 [Chromobacterium sp. ATCC 53434]
MDNHDLAESLTGLASRMNDLMVATTGDDSRRFQDLQSELSGQAMAAIARSLDQTTSQYADAVATLQSACSAADDAERRLAQTANSIEFVAKALKLAAQASGQAAALLA